MLSAEVSPRHSRENDGRRPGRHTSPVGRDAGSESTPHRVAAYETESVGVLSGRTIPRATGVIRRRLQKREDSPLQVGRPVDDQGDRLARLSRLEGDDEPLTVGVDIET